MKKRTKEILAGALALCILLSAPVCVEAVEAVGRLSMDREWASVFQKDLQPEDRPEISSNDRTGALSEEAPEDKTEVLPEEA
ncbi:MAG: hypothetical protein K2G51_03880 [Lachnospiraceae bacterium]|nr:hypothetical protein [Lachnospiraceae bacterium]